MIDWLTIVIALVIIAILVGFFGILAWKITMSDPLARDDQNQLSDSNNEKRRKEKNTTEQGKKKRKDQKKSKRENKDEEQRNKPKQATVQTSEETDDEREESEQELLITPSQTTETSSKARKRNKNKSQSASTDEKTSEPPVVHPKSASKDQHESTKQQVNVQMKSSQTKQPTVAAPLTTTTKKSTQPDQNQEQPFTVVGGNKHKAGTPPGQQQNKPQVNTTSSVAPAPQTTTAPVQHDQLAQRVHKETPAQHSTQSLNPPSSKQQTSTVTPKVADLIKVLPSSQAVVTELMTALDAFPLSTDELDIIMHKIANKQSVLKQDWTKLQHGKKVDPQAHIGQVMDESAKAYENDVKNNSMKRIKELTDELNAEKRRNNDLSKEKTDKDREIEILHAQLDSVHQKQEPTQVNSQRLQTLEFQLKRLNDENAHLTQQLTSGDSSSVKVQVLSEQMKKLSVDNANWEKKATSQELLAKEAQKEKEDLIRYNEQLTQSLQNAEKDLKHIEEKHHKQLNESRTSHLNEINEHKRRIEQLENDNEQLRREEIVHVEPSTATDIQTITVDTEEREQLEQEISQLKQTIQLNRDKQRELNEDIERMKQEKNTERQQADESHKSELNALRNELKEVKSSISQSEDRFRQEREKHRHLLTDLLSQDLRNQLPNDNQDSDQWLSSYRQLSQSNKRALQEESTELKRENEQLHKNMTEIENQLKDIEKTVQSKEEILLTELKSKDDVVESIRLENDQLNGELQRLRNENHRLQSAHDASVNETRALKHQLEEKFLAGANTPSVVADESFELVKQPSPSLSPIVIDIRAEQLNELIRSSKEALENQDTITQQLDKHLNDINRSGSGETSNVAESTVSSSSDQHS